MDEVGGTGGQSFEEEHGIEWSSWVVDSSFARELVPVLF